VELFINPQAVAEVMAVLLEIQDQMVEQVILVMLDSQVIPVIMDPQVIPDMELLQEMYHRYQALGRGNMEILEILEQLPHLYIP